jgi:hypothetical protein
VYFFSIGALDIAALVVVLPTGMIVVLAGFEPDVFGSGVEVLDGELPDI